MSAWHTKRKTTGELVKVKGFYSERRKGWSNTVLEIRLEFIQQYLLKLGLSLSSCALFVSFCPGLPRLSCSLVMFPGLHLDPPTLPAVFSYTRESLSTAASLTSELDLRVWLGHASMLFVHVLIRTYVHTCPQHCVVAVRC